MTSLETMYAPQANSPATTLAGPLSTGTVQFDVLDGGVLPEAPMLLVIGGDSPNAETVLLTAKNGNSLTVERAVQGQARSWNAGTEVARLFTAADLQAVQDNITALAEGKAELVHSHSQYLTAESDPTVPAWAKEETKPSYTATEVGAAAAEHTHSQYLTAESDPTVPSWAKQPAKPSYTASEVGADAAGTASSAVATHNAAADAHADLFAAKADSSHNQAASTITAGTLGGQVIANSAGQTPSASLLRNSKLVSTETAPTVNGEICWTYE